MTASADVFVLDVGHGNCAVILSEASCAVVDVAHAATLIDFLAGAGVTHLNALLLSHADADHIGGLIALLAEGTVNVDFVFVNPDAQKQSKLWRDLRVVLKDAAKAGKISLRTSLNAVDPGNLTFDEFRIEVLAPDADAALGGPGEKRAGETVVSSNDHSVVLRLWSNDTPRILFAADITIDRWRRLTSENGNLKADVLILPHHGGSLGGTVNGIEEILASVAPVYGIVSNGRGRHDNPRPATAEALRRANVRMLCTQLSERCGKKGNAGDLKEPLPARGAIGSACCAGTIKLEMRPDATVVTVENEHAQYVAGFGEKALCHGLADGPIVLA